MLFDRTLLWSSVTTKHLLESRLHLVAAIEAMADMEGFVAEHQKAVQMRAGLDDVFMAVEDKTADIVNKLKQSDQGPDADDP